MRSTLFAVGTGTIGGLNDDLCFVTAGRLACREIGVSHDDRYAGDEPISEPIREKRRDTVDDFFARVLKLQKRAYIAECLSPARFQVRQPFVGLNGAMEDLTVVAPDQDRFAVAS